MPLILSVVFFLYLANKTYKAKCLHVSFVLIFYALGCFIGYVQTKHDLYFTSNNYGINGQILYDATIYLMLCTFILMYPLFYNVKHVNLSFKVRKLPFLIMTDILIVLAIIYIIICLPHLKDSFNALDFVVYKENVMEKGLNYTEGNPILGIIFDLQDKTRPFMPFLLFYMLSYIDGNSKRKVLFTIMTILPVVVTSIVSAHRHIVVYCLIQILIAYLLFYKSIPLNAKRRINVVIFVVIVLVAFIVVLFAFLRFDDGSDYILYSLLRYYGEPFVNFNTMLWDNSSYLMGNKSFPLIRNWLGFDVIDQQNIREITDYVRYANNYFYSAVGTFYMDFGIGAIIVCLAIAVIFKIILSHFRTNQFVYTLLIYLYCVYSTQNYFYFQFQGNTNGLVIWYLVFIIIINHFIVKNRYKNET